MTNMNFKMETSQKFYQMRELILTMYSNTYSNYQLVLWFASMP